MKKSFSQKIALASILFFFLLTFSHVTEARKIYSRQTGNWTTTTSWVGGNIPSLDGDTVIIQFGHTISITDNRNYSSSTMFIIILGSLDVSSNGRLRIAADSNVIIETGGSLIGNAAGSDMVDIGGGTAEYTGNMGIISGPTYINNGNPPVSGGGTAGCGCYTGIGNCVITSSDGYSVSINVSATRIIANPAVNCTSGPGYNYNVELDYVITFSGTNIPSSLYTLQGNVVCGSTSIFFDLPNTGGVGTTVTTSNPWRGVADCQTATPISLNCLNASIQIDGPGIASGSSCASTLPINLISFSGKQTPGGIQLDWVTSSESKFDYFEVQRAGKDLSFKSLEKVEGKGGMEVTAQYTYVDELFLLGKNYYRLKSVDLDGTFEYSDVVLVESFLEPMKTPALLYPNPVVNGQLFIRETDSYTKLQTLIIYNSYGQEILRKTMDNSTEINLPALSAGVFLVKLVFQEGVKVESLVVN